MHGLVQPQIWVGCSGMKFRLQIRAICRERTLLLFRKVISASIVEQGAGNRYRFPVCSVVGQSKDLTLASTARQVRQNGPPIPEIDFIKIAQMKCAAWARVDGQSAQRWRVPKVHTSARPSHWDRPIPVHPRREKTWAISLNTREPVRTAISRLNGYLRREAISALS